MGFGNKVDTSNFQGKTYANGFAYDCDPDENELTAKLLPR